ncbi:hypothetical protein LEP1GSC123_3501 [Leptospira borgpetersenii str. 200701203]|uniref:Uncharacterized protein n=1 Tax=Leptospira borgpetersenii str. 200701203 TaxID=1193007 RepID=M3H3K7_LEPBO|nr:hypothetical protein LEP1GSC123_3501 [Leptospira borgpetersenii str. 200701203]
MIGKIFPIVFLSFAGLIPASSLFAQVECRGNACAIIPGNVSSQFNGLENEIRTKYLNEVVESMGDAALLTTLNSSMMGSGSINHSKSGPVCPPLVLKMKTSKFNMQELLFRICRMEELLFLLL